MALAATGVGLVADAGIAAGVGAGEGLAIGAAEVGGMAAADVSAEAAAAVGGNAWNTTANVLNWTAFGIGGVGAARTCNDEGFSANCAAGISLGIGGLATGGAGYLAGEYPWLFWGNAGLGFGYGVAGERDFNCGGWRLG